MDPAVVLGVTGVFALVGGLFLFLGLRSLSAARASQLWPSTPGKITSSQLMAGGTRSKPWYKPQVTYTFAVNGQAYTGENVFFGNARSNSSGKPQAVVDRYREGAEVEVFYNPHQPQQAVLERRTGPSNTIFLILGPLLLILAAFVAIMGLMQ
ncbi:MAG TPA: DUF3592 domain-containing protein [Chthoniobacterales bacterium]|jgi:hypothetical protein|nr:DUF3592 domain-containing protein [Chthoniobacterales bacterium]